MFRHGISGIRCKAPLKQYSARSYSSVLRYADRAKSTVHAQLAENDDHDDKTTASHHVTQLENFDETLSARHQRLHPHTLMGKTTANKHLVMPSRLCDVVSETTLNHKPQDIRQTASQYFVDLQATGAHQPAKTEIDVDAHLNAVFLQSYASIHNVLQETVRRLGAEWRPSSVLDVGFGPATGIVALNEIFDGDNAEKLFMSRKESVIIGHPAMKKRAKKLLKQQNDTDTRVLQHLPGFNTVKYDLIIATHQLYRSDFHFPASVDDHSVHLLSLLNPNGVLVLVERGDPSGFESIARARQIMLRPEDYPGDTSKIPRTWKKEASVVSEPNGDETTASSFKLKIVAPCSHHGKCPLQVGLDVRREVSSTNPGFFNWCKFGQMVQRPKFTMELKKGQYMATEWDQDTPGKGAGGKHLAGSGRPFGLSYETANHSYLVVQRHQTDEQVLKPDDSWPRVMRTPMKRDKHVIMEVCTPNADIEQWTVTKGFSKQAYHDARKATGGDLWALKAKTVQKRGGNRAARAKVERRAVGNNKNKSKKQAKTVSSADAGGVDEIGNEIVDAAYNRSRAQFQQTTVRGHDPHPDDEDMELEQYFEQLGKEFEQSHSYQRQTRKESKAKYRENRPNSRW